MENHFLERDGQFSVFEWPVQSPDLNPIEYLWDEMERVVRSMNVPPSNLQQLHDAIASAWNDILVERFRHLCRIPPNNQAVLEAKRSPSPVLVGCT